MQAKEINKLMAVLTNDRLVQTYVVVTGMYSNLIDMRYRHRQNELKEGAQRSVLKQYYYIDYQFFCNVVKWRVAEMRRRIDTNLRNVSIVFASRDHSSQSRAGTGQQRLHLPAVQEVVLYD